MKLNQNDYSMYTYSFERLAVWIESKELTKTIYKITTSFPDSERFGLTSQLRRASVSICSNIAEGPTRNTSKDKAHFLTIAYGSTIEVLNQVIISFELLFISEKTYLLLRSELESISNKINALRNYQLNQQPKP